MKPHGNPAWGRPLPASLQVTHVCEFDRICMHLKLKTKEDMIRSYPLRQWIYKYFNQRYVPEWLLKHWGLIVELRRGW
jgi:hypothetical protein